MTWQFILDGGPWAVALAVAWAVWKGHLVLGREMDDLKGDYAELRDRHSRITEQLTTSQAAEREQLVAANAELRAELEALKRGEPT